MRGAEIKFSASKVAVFKKTNHPPIPPPPLQMLVGVSSADSLTFAVVIM